MSNEIERYQDHTREVAPITDSWVNVMADVSKLATHVADTDFVPASMKGNPAAVAAAILAGREMGVPPMTALQHIHVIKGKPGQSAQLMRAKVLEAGHQLRDVEVNDTRCIIEGRRRGEEQWTRVTYTADQAKRAQINLGGYPEDKLYARATTRLCRRKFADVIGGLSHSVEELEDGTVDDVGQAPAPAQASAKRTAQRRQAPRKATATVEKPAPAQPEPEEPPLPGEDGYDEPAQPAGNDETVTKAQLTKLGAIFTEHKFGDRAQRLRISSSLVGRELSSSNELTKAEATTLIDTLENLASTGDLPGVVEEMLTDDARDAEDDAVRDEAAAETSS
jgi:hypothetical protein